MELLRNLSIFASASDEIIEEVARHLERIRVARGERICRQGARGNTLYFIRSGQVRVSIRLLDGEEETCGYLGPGDHFGEMSVITGAPISADVTATTETELDCLEGTEFHRLCEKYPLLYKEISRTLSKRLLQSNQKRVSSRLGRVSRFGVWRESYNPDLLFPVLLSLGEAFREETGRNPLLIVPASQREIEKEGILHLFEQQTRFKISDDPGPSFQRGAEKDKLGFQVAQVLGEDRVAWYSPSGKVDLLLWKMEKTAHSSETWSLLEDLLYQVRPFYSQILVCQFDWPAEVLLERRLPNDNIAFFVDMVSEGFQLQATREDYVRYVPEGKRCPPEPGRSYWVLSEESFEEIRQKAAYLEKWAENDSNLEVVVLHSIERPLLDYSRIRSLCRKVSLHTLPVPPQEDEDDIRNPSAPSLAVVMGRCPSFSRGKIVRNLGGLQIGLALGGGGARGLAHVGVIKTLEEEGIPIDLIAGSSFGAVTAAAYAEGRTGKRLVEDMRYHWSRLGNVLLDILDYEIPRTNLLRGRKIRRMIQEAMKESTIQGCQIPLYVVCTDLISGQEYVVEEGPLGEAIWASGSLPGIYRPIWWKGHLLVDGAVLNKVPARVLRQRGARIVLAVNVTPDRDTNLLPNRDPKSRIQRVLSRMPPFRKWATHPNIIRILSRSLSVSGLHQSRIHSEDIDVEIKPRIEQFDFLRFDQFDEIVEAGAQAAREAIPKIRKAIRLAAEGKASSPAVSHSPHECSVS